VTVTVPLLDEVLELLETEAVKLPLLEPLDGETVSQDWLLDTVHETFEVTLTLREAVEADGDHVVVGLMVSEALSPA
jgi:hypothetical protein